MSKTFLRPGGVSVLVCVLGLLVLLSRPLIARDSPTSHPAAATQPATVSHTLVLLVLAEHPPQLDAEGSAVLQGKHLAHIKAMSESGKVLVAGPFDNRDDPNLRGQLIFNCPIEEARAMANQDPAVKAGRLKVVCMSWLTQEGAMTFAAEKQDHR